MPSCRLKNVRDTAKRADGMPAIRPFPALSDTGYFLAPSFALTKPATAGMSEIAIMPTTIISK